MNQTARAFSRNVMYTLAANVISLLFNMVLVLVLPKRIDTVQFAYWQLYQLYALYTGYITFGITDGVYLRYGGEEYENLPKPLFRTQFWFLFGGNLVFDLILFGFYWQLVNDQNKWFIVVLACLTGLLYVPRTLITITFQATNRIKEYAGITIFEKLSVLVIVVIMMVAGFKGFTYYVYADLLGKALTLLYAVFSAKDLVIGKFSEKSQSFKETRKNITVGSKILISNLSSLLINGSVRFIIEQKWGIEVFGQISFSFSVSNILISLILAVSIVFFPMLKRMHLNQYAKLYLGIRSKLMIPMAGLFLLYFPIRGLLSIWLPAYTSSLRYMALLFPLSLYESNMKLLGNNYLKAMRKENYLLFNNVGSVLLALILAYFSAQVLEDLNLTVFVIFLAYAIRCILAEKYLNKILKINTNKDISLELVLSLVFIVSGWYLPILAAGLVYFAVYMLYLYAKRDEVKKALHWLAERYK